MICDVGEGVVYIKIGISKEPTTRLVGLTHGLPFDPQLFSYCLMQTRDRAKQMEADILAACERWGSRGEWLKLRQTESADFRAVLKAATAKYQSRLLPLMWHQIDVRKFREAKAEVRIDRLRASRSKPRLRRLRGLSALSYGDFKRQGAVEIH